MMKTISKLLFSIFIIWQTYSYAGPQTIKFAMEATYPPFESVSAEGNLVGFDIDIANSICHKMNAVCIFINSPWESLIPGLKLGKFDAIISALMITPEREKQVAFSQSYYVSTASFVAAKTQSFAPLPAGLAGKRVGVQGGTAMENYMRGYYKNSAITVKTYASISDAFLDLKSGRIDAVLADTSIAKNWLAKLAKPDYEIVGPPISDTTYFGQGLGIAVNKKNTALLEEINQSLTAIKADGTYQRLVTKYFGQ